MTLAGMSAQEIGLALHVTARTVARDRKDMGVAKPGPRYMTADQIDVAKRLLDDGCSYKEASRSVGVSNTTMARTFPGRGWTKRQGGEFRAFLRSMERRTPGGAQ